MSLGKGVLRVILTFLVVLLLLSFLVFALSRACPGDPLMAYFGDGLERMSEVEKDAARDRLGLNDSLLTQYGRWFAGALHGDLGLSYQYKEPVGRVIGDLWGNTLLLGGVSYGILFALAIWLGAFCALREGSRTDRIIRRIGILSSNVPAFFLSMVLILIFSVKLGILPASGAYDYGQSGSVISRITHLILPVTVLVLEHLWYYAYLIRNKLMEETRKEYVLLAKANGLSRRRIMIGHCLRNSLPSLLVLMALAVPHILGGTYVVEMVFGYPGLGTLSMQSALYKDYNMLMAITMITGMVVLFFNMGAQWLDRKIDPRLEVMA